jgi:hypothetical protein
MTIPEDELDRIAKFAAERDHSVWLPSACGEEGDRRGKNQRRTQRGCGSGKALEADVRLRSFAGSAR